MEIVYSLAGETAVELVSSDNTDDEEDSDDPSDEKEEKSSKTDTIFFAHSSLWAFVFTESGARTSYAEMPYPIAFHLIEPPYSPPEMI